jgi:hypothetical protein
MSDRNIDKWLGLFFGTVMTAVGSRWLGEALGVPDNLKFTSAIIIICSGNYHFQKWFRGGDE